jgi:hypothetical protein
MKKKTAKAAPKAVVLGALPGDTARVRQSLSELGWPQSRLARESGLSLIMVNSFINGNRRLSFAASDRVLDAIRRGFDKKKADDEARKTIDRDVESKAMEKVFGDADGLKNLRALAAVGELQGPPRDPVAYRAWKARQLELLSASDDLRAERARNAELEKELSAQRVRTTDLEKEISLLERIKSNSEELVSLYQAQVGRLKQQLLGAGITPND